MTCDEVEASLPERGNEPGVQAHLAECADCRETAAVLGLAAQAPLRAEERARLVSLPIALASQWERLERKRTAARKFVALAVAASLGAVVASGLMWKLLKVPSAAAKADPEILMVMDDAAPLLADEDLSFEVSWPSLNEEGDGI
jgi:hypothetical protein